MKLACLRCRNHKIKCDKGEPVCHQCITAKTECTYVDRKKRPRLAQQKLQLRQLSRRLEYVEKNLQNGENASTPSPLRDESIEEDTDSETPSYVSPKGDAPPENGQDSWIYRLASDARQNFEKVHAHGTSVIADTPDVSTVNSAMSGLNEALEDLGKLRIRSHENVLKGQKFEISPEKASECMKMFCEMIDSMVIPEVFSKYIDLSLLQALPHVTNSPFVTIDPAIRVSYYAALYYGLHRLNGPDDGLAQAAYYKSLEAVPTWLNSATGTDMDGYTAALMTWTAITNFDYQLSWKFHCKACHWLKQAGIDHLDKLPAATIDEENTRQGLRYLYWHVLQTDLLFRLFYGKPAAMKWSPNKVQTPSLFSPKNMQPKAAQSILFIVWIRHIVLTAELFQFIEDHAGEEHEQQVSKEVDLYCERLQEMIDEWNIEALMRDARQSQNQSIAFLYGDHVTAFYASMVGMKRLIRRKDSRQPLVDEVTLRAARKVIDIILFFNNPGDNMAPLSHEEMYFLAIQSSFVAFFSFCAIFSLYESILASSSSTSTSSTSGFDPDACEPDLQSLEHIGAIMKSTSESRAEFMPIYNTVKALNKVSRTMQDERRRVQTAETLGTMSHPNPNPSGSTINTGHAHTNFSTGSGSASTGTAFSLPATPLPGGLNQPPLQADPHIHIHPSLHTQEPFRPFSPTIDISAPNFPYLADFGMNGVGEAQLEPLDFVRALESGFMERNWHEGWWDMDGDGDVDVGLGA